MKTTFTVINGTILTIDEKDNCYENGAMIVKDGCIHWIGHENQVQPQGEVIDLKGGLVMPGLVNTHTHTHSSIFRNFGDDMELMDWLNYSMWPTERFLTGELAYDATRMSCLEFIRSGITAYADQFYFAEDVAAAAAESGLCCYLAPSVFTRATAETDNTLKAAVQFIEKWHGRQEETGVHVCIGPHAPYSVDEKLFKEAVELAKKYDIILHTHISETKDENRQIQERYGMSPVQWLESMGVMEAKVLAAHCIHLSDEDMDIFQRNRVHVSYNPISNLKLVSGIMPVKNMLERGICVSIGTDGAQSNNSMDLLNDLKTGVLLQKQILNDAEFLPAREAIRMATIEGARALYCEESRGSLELGKRADFIILDSKSPRLTPLIRSSAEKLYAAIVYSAYGADVVSVCAGGRWLMKQREVLTLNEEEVLQKAQAGSLYLAKSAGLSWASD